MTQMKWIDRKELCWYSRWECVKILCSVEKFPWKWEFLAAKRTEYSVYGSSFLIIRGSTNVSVFITHLNLKNHQNINLTSLSGLFTCGRDKDLFPDVFRWFLPLKDVLGNGGPSILHWGSLDDDRRWEPRGHTELSGCPRPGFWERITKVLCIINNINKPKFVNFISYYKSLTYQLEVLNVCSCRVAGYARVQATIRGHYVFKNQLRFLLVRLLTHVRVSRKDNKRQEKVIKTKEKSTWVKLPVDIESLPVATTNYNLIIIIFLLTHARLFCLEHFSQKIANENVGRFLTIFSLVVFLTHCMVGVGCPVALQITDTYSPGLTASLVWSKTTVGRSEKLN